MASSVSVVLAAYNGINYISEQLDSIKAQTLPPNEVIIMDDHSSDETADYVRNYIKNNKLNTWKLIENKTNQGWKKNFKNGFDIATGDYIFPCDQDDIWKKDKIEKMVNCMESNLSLDLLVSNYEIFYDGEKRSGYKKNIKSVANSGTVKKIQMNKHWFYSIRPGCTFCFRNNFYTEIKKYWKNEWAHDAALWRFACIKGTLGLFDHSTIFFRRHGDNVTSSKEISKERRLYDINYIYNVLNDFKTYLLICFPEDQKKLKILNDSIKFTEMRKKFLISRNPFVGLKLLIFHIDEYLYISSFLGDVLCTYIK